MKRTFKKILMVLAVAGLAGCSEYLDKEPLSDIEENDPYKNFKNFQGFVEELYNSIPIMTSQEYHCCWNFGEDDYWEPNEPRLMTYAIDQGNFWGWNETYYTYFNVGGKTETTERMDKGHLYTLCWRGINKCNIGLANFDKLVDATSEERDLIKGQLLFFRGWFHFMLMQYWGGLPYIDDVLAANEPMRLPRLNYQQTAEKAAEDFQAAADILPIDWDKTTAGKTTLGRNWTRANKIMALAYLGKDLLWAGSPLMNKESTGSPTYNADLCKRAADAFGQALSLTESTGRYELADFDHYSDIFYTYKQNIINGLKEVIFYENLAAGNPGAWRWNLVNDFRPSTL
ncbi:MAG: RagB/SusD family nutrient uptake outer membrane protein, partial [Bacteroidales bacterium]|nr:RagB/SusD family nutrient uptake outer membrane protein [Bacteroidales bacterium]